MPSTFETWGKARTRVRSPTRDAAASRSSVPSSFTGMCRRTAPVRAASSCQGMRLAWCSDSVTTISSPGASAYCRAASPPRPAEALPIEYATRLMPAVAPLVHTSCSGCAPMNPATVARASSNSSVASAASVCAPRCTAAFALVRNDTSASITACGFWLVAAESRYTSGASPMYAARIGKSRRSVSGSSPVVRGEAEVTLPGYAGCDGVGWAADPPLTARASIASVAATDPGSGLVGELETRFLDDRGLER